MARIAGKGGQIAYDLSSGSPDISTEAVTSWEMDYKGDVIDVTGMDSAGAKAFIPSLTEATAQLEILATGAIDTDLYPGLELEVELYPVAGARAATSSWNFTAIVTGCKPTVEVSGAVKYSVTVQATGAIAYGVSAF